MLLCLQKLTWTHVIHNKTHIGTYGHINKLQVEDNPFAESDAICQRVLVSKPESGHICWTGWNDTDQIYANQTVVPKIEKFW